LLLDLEYLRSKKQWQLCKGLEPLAGFNNALKTQIKAPILKKGGEK